MEETNASLRAFDRELAQLRNSKNSIKATTKIAMACDPADVSRRIAERVTSQSSEDNERVVLLYVVDSICKCAALKGVASMIDAFGQHIGHIAHTVASAPGTSQQTINTVHKVLGYWVQRSIFSDEVVQSILQKLPSGEQAKKLSQDKLQHGPPPDKKSYDKRSSDKKLSSSGGKRKGPPSSRHQGPPSSRHQSSPDAKKPSSREKIEICLQPAKPPTAATTGDHVGAERERRNQDYNNRYSHEESSHTHVGGFDDLWGDPSVPSPHPKPAGMFLVPTGTAEPFSDPPAPSQPSGTAPDARLPHQNGVLYTPSDPPTWTPSDPKLTPTVP